LLIIEGRISHDDFSGGIRVSARKLFDLQRREVSLRICLKLSCNGQSDAVKLSAILAPYCNKASDKRLCPVKIEYHNAQGQASLMLGR
jgi:DNA polymerase III subunit alpha